MDPLKRAGLMPYEQGEKPWRPAPAFLPDLTKKTPSPEKPGSEGAPQEKHPTEKALPTKRHKKVVPVSSYALIKTKAMLELVSISKGALYLKLDPESPYFDPTFPRPIRLSDNAKAIYWVLSEVEEWIQARMQARDTLQETGMNGRVQEDA